MRLLLYNIRYGTGSGGRFHLPVPYSGYVKGTSRNFERITAFVQEQQPDVTGLVEVDLGTYRSRWRNQAERMADALGHAHVYQSKYCGNCFMKHIPIMNRQGNAILTADSIHAMRFHHFDRGIKRLVIELELERVVVLLVHLSIKFRHRHDQLRSLLTMIRSIEKPLVVIGDFNPLWGENELELFLQASGLSNANRDGIPTWPSRSPERQLDFILHSKAVEVTRFAVPDVRFSDHRPLVAEFKVNGNASLGGTS